MTIPASSTLTRRTRHALVACLVGLTLIATHPARAQTSARGATAADLPHRDPDIHWPAAFNPSTAKIFSHNELLIHADCHRVFTRLTDLTSWPTWFVLTKDVQLQGPDTTVKEGAIAHLLIFGTPITTRITEFVPDSLLAWSPKGDTEPQPGHYHTWRFIPQPTGCRVETEETGITAQDANLAQAGDTFMHRAHDLWLASLKWTSEQYASV